MLVLYHPPKIVSHSVCKYRIIHWNHKYRQTLLIIKHLGMRDWVFANIQYADSFQYGARYWTSIILWYRSDCLSNIEWLVIQYKISIPKELFIDIKIFHQFINRIIICNVISFFFIKWISLNCGIIQELVLKTKILVPVLKLFEQYAALIKSPLLWN